ncbi:MAG: hypothetical protein ACI33J_04525 [Clostridium sp.]
MEKVTDLEEIQEKEIVNEVILSIIDKNIKELANINGEFWINTLEVDYSMILDKCNEFDKSYVKRIFNSIDIEVKKAILKKYGYNSVREILDEFELPNEIKEVIKDLALLKEYSSKLNYDVIISYLEIDKKIDFKFNKIKMMTALLLNKGLCKDELLTYLLISKCERYSYNHFIMNVNREDDIDEVELAEIKEFEDKGVNIDKILSNKVIDDFLEKYESENKTGLISKCVKSFIYKKELIIFILRDAFREGARTVKKFIVNTKAEYIVLRFSLDSKNLRIRTLKDNEDEFCTYLGEEIVEYFNNKYKVTYISSELYNSDEDIERFKLSCIKESITNISLYQIDFVNEGILGLPIISIQQESNKVSLKKSIDAEGNGELFKLLVNSKLRKVKVKYFDGKDHIFTLKFEDKGEKTLIFISGKGGGIDKRRNLIKLYKAEVGINILEVKEK